jgi:hypothetical protein
MKEFLGTGIRYLLAFAGGSLLTYVDPNAVEAIARGTEQALTGTTEQVVGGVLTAAGGIWAAYEANRRARKQQRLDELERQLRLNPNPARALGGNEG